MTKMMVTSAQYVASVNADGTVDDAEYNINATIDGVAMNVPKDPANRHYAAILEWVAEGNTIADAD